LLKYKAFAQLKAADLFLLNFHQSLAHTHKNYRWRQNLTCAGRPRGSVCPEALVNTPGFRCVPSHHNVTHAAQR
jgi:hypothetical protein